MKSYRLVNNISQYIRTCKLRHIPSIGDIIKPDFDNDNISYTAYRVTGRVIVEECIDRILIVEKTIFKLKE